MSDRPLKLISLNTWSGRIRAGLMSFLSQHSDTDIFCFQEIAHRAIPGSIRFDQFDPTWNLFEEMQEILSDHQGFFREHLKGTFGLAAFIKKDINLISESDRFVYIAKADAPVEEGKNSRNVQVISISISGREFHIFNFHGLWTGGGKDDIKSRLEQSRNIAKFVNEFRNGKILCGDFNLLPSTQSLKIIEDIPLRNLVKEFGVTSTRTSYYLKPNKFADYMFVNDTIEVDYFTVLPDEVSDHFPLQLLFH